MEMEVVDLRDLEFNNYLNSLKEREAITGVAGYIQTNAGYFFKGDVFEAETVKGGTNYIYFCYVKQGWVFYIHGDRGKKIRREQFLNLIDYGDLVFVPKESRDPERLALCVLGLAAKQQGLTLEDMLMVEYGHGRGTQV